MPPLSYQPQYQPYDNKAREALKTFMAQPAVRWQEDKFRTFLGDLQANILKHHHKEHSEYHFITFAAGKRAEVKEWLAGFAQEITSARQQFEQIESETATITSLYLTCKGYQYLDIPDSVIPDGQAFRTGLSSRILLDKSAVQKPLSDAEKEVHAIILFAHNIKGGVNAGSSQLREAHKALMDRLSRLTDGKPLLIKGSMRNPLPPRYHFKEGMGNPQFFPDASHSKAQKPFHPADAAPLSLALVQDKGGNHPHSCGSFGAFMKLKVDDDAIHQLEQEIRKKASGAARKISDDHIRALLIGRFADGTPLSLSDKPQNNPTDQFDYRELVRINPTQTSQGDEQGARCPFSAHIRKAYSRLPEAANIRIVRRGAFYKDGDKERGLLFLSFQNSLEDQFEYILNNWMLNRFSYFRDEKGEMTSIDSGKDLLFSRANDTYRLPEVWNQEMKNGKGPLITVTVPKQMVTFLGGLYFFAPAISFFKNLSPPNPVAGRSRTTPEKPDFIAGTEVRIELAPPPPRHPRKPATQPEFLHGMKILLHGAAKDKAEQKKVSAKPAARNK